MVLPMSPAFGERAGQGIRDVLIQRDLHPNAGLSACLAKRSVSLACSRETVGKVVQELGQGSFAVEVVEQRSHGNPGSAEHDRAAHDLGVPAERRRLVLDHCPDDPFLTEV